MQALRWCYGNCGGRAAIEPIKAMPDPNNTSLIRRSQPSRQRPRMRSRWCSADHLKNHRVLPLTRISRYQFRVACELLCGGETEREGTSLESRVETRKAGQCTGSQRIFCSPTGRELFP